MGLFKKTEKPTEGEKTAQHSVSESLTPKPESVISMTRKFEGERLVVATHNRGKLKEFAELLEGHITDISCAADHSLEEPEETGQTFEENAVLKAKLAAKATGMVAMADDSGLCVNALGGQPGIHSARWAGKSQDFNAAMARVQEELGTTADRSAKFVCVLALAWPDGHVETVTGEVEGTLTWPPKGDMGFGYDPIFRPKGYQMSFAEMAPPAKKAISHRGKAFKELLARCF